MIPSQQAVVEGQASRAAAEKLKQALDPLRNLRAFEDEPAHFAGWIEQHADGEGRGLDG